MQKLCENSYQLLSFQIPKTKLCGLVAIVGLFLTTGLLEYKCNKL